MHRALIVFSAVLFLAHLNAAPAALAERLAAPQSAPTSLFTPFTTVQVTPTGSYLNADFVRVGYVPAIDRVVVTFNTMLSQSAGNCSNSFDNHFGLYREYVYREYTTDMTPGTSGFVSCHGTTDTGGFFNGNDFYLASAETNDGVEGWNLAKFNAATWKASVDKWYPFTTQPSWRAGDPTVALVDGQIDVSSGYDGGPGTHHHTFTTNLDFVKSQIVNDTEHLNYSSLITVDGITYFLSSKGGALEWSVIVMEYGPNWTYRNVVKTLRENAATPQGLAFDGSRFYVAYTSQERTNGGLPMCENVRLAAFDTSWNLLDDIALTNFTLADQTSSLHPSLAMKDNRLYVSYSQNAPAGGVETLQAWVKVFELSTAPICTSFTISPTSASPSGSAGSQQVTLIGSPSGCVGGSWTASGNGSWLSVSPASGTQPGTVTVSWTANTVASPRSSTATIAGNTFAVSQAGGLPVLTATRAYDSTEGASVNVSWTNPGSATGFVLERATNLGGFTPYVFVGSTSYTDHLGASAPPITLLYRVHESGSTQYSNIDYTTVVFFTDDPLAAGTTTVKALHLTELRQAIDAMRIAANLSPVTWTDSSPTGVEVKASHITELRNTVTAAITAFSAATPSFTDSTMASGQTIKAAHFQELRAAVK